MLLATRLAEVIYWKPHCSIQSCCVCNILVWGDARSYNKKKNGTDAVANHEMCLTPGGYIIIVIIIHIIIILIIIIIWSLTVNLYIHFVSLAWYFKNWYKLKNFVKIMWLCQSERISYNVHIVQMCIYCMPCICPILYCMSPVFTVLSDNSSMELMLFVELNRL